MQKTICSHWAVFRWLLCILIASPVLAQGQGQIPPRSELRRQFEELYKQYLQAPPRSPISSVSYSPAQGLWMKKMADLGPRVAPLLIEKLEETRDFSLCEPLYLVTRKVFEQADWPGAKLGDSRGEAEMYVKWWHDGFKKTPEKFAALYAVWQANKGPGDTVVLSQKSRVFDNKTKRISEVATVTEAGAAWASMEKLGVAALPYMMAKLEEGDFDMLPMIAKLTDGKSEAATSATPADRSVHCLKWWNDNKEYWIMTDLPLEAENRGK